MILLMHKPHGATYVCSACRVFVVASFLRVHLFYSGRARRFAGEANINHHICHAFYCGKTPIPPPMSVPKRVSKLLNSLTSFPSWSIAFVYNEFHLWLPVL